MPLRINNNLTLPGMTGGSPAAIKPAGISVMEGFELHPGEAAYFGDNSGKVVRPPLNNKTAVAFSVAPTSGDTLGVTVEGTAYSQAFDTDAATTMAALAAKVQADTNVQTCTAGEDDKSLELIAVDGKTCTVTAATNSDGTTTSTITHYTTDKFAFLVVFEPMEAIDGTTKFTEKTPVTGVLDNDSVLCLVHGGESDEYDIKTPVRVRVVAGENERAGQIVCTEDDPDSVIETSLSFAGSGESGNYEHIYVTKGA